VRINIVIAILFFSCQQQTKSSAQDSSRPVKTESQVVKGIYSYGLAKNFMNSTSLNLDYIDVMTAAFTWQDMEPQEGKYDFSQIDGHIAWASSHQKKVNIVLYAGNKSPQWLYEKKIPAIHWSRKWKEDQAIARQSTHEQETAPVFWDLNYLLYWKKFVSVLAERYRDNDHIGYILITGPTPKDYTTGTVIRYDEDWEKVVDLGYTYEKHLAAWTDLVDHYVRVLPMKNLVIALGPLRPATSDLTISEGVTNHVLKQNYGNVQFLCVVLNDTWFTDSPGALKLRSLFKKMKDHGHAFGYQMIYAAQRNDSFKNKSNKLIENFGATLDIAVEDGVSWIEIWHDDIILPKSKSQGNPNAKYSEAIKKAHHFLTN